MWGTDPAERASIERVLLRCVAFIGALHGLIILERSEIAWLAPS